METAIPPYPETIDILDHAIENGLWPSVWCRKLLEVPEGKCKLWLLLAQEVWTTASFLDEATVQDTNTAGQLTYDNEVDLSRFGESKVTEETHVRCTHTSDTRIARLILGRGDPCKHLGRLTPAQQDEFEQSTFAEIRRPKEPYSIGRDIRLIYIKIIQKGREEGLWELCIPSYPVVISRPIPRTQLHNLNRLFEAREVRNKLLFAIRNNSPWLEEHRLGVILLCAMFFDGLIEEAGIEALANSIDRPLVRGPSGYWLDLLLDPNKPSRTRIRRFWPHPLTTMLWLRYARKDDKEESASKAVEDLLIHLLEKKPPSISQLIKGIAQEISLEIPELLVHVATGKTLTHPIKARRWHTVQCIGSPAVDVPVLIDSVSHEKSIALDNNSVTEKNTQSDDEPLLDLVTPPGMVQLRAAMREKNINGMVKSLELTLQEEESQPPIINHLARWLKKPSTNARSSTRRWMFGLVGARLVSLCGDDDPKLYDDDELESLYTMILENGKSTSQRRGMRYTLISFHRYLSQNDPIKRPSLLNELERSEVSSRVITHDEYHQALKLLAQPRPTDNDTQLLLACQISLILFFRLGMRRRELLYLPLHDIHGEHTIEILVRPFSKRTLKTRNALRSLMLNGFLSSSELKLVQDWLSRRRNEATVNPEDFYFFSLANSERNLISEPSVIDRIVDALRTVTNDPGIHIHHLRHSFATWLTLSLVGDAVEDDFQNFHHLPMTQQWMRSFPITVKQFYKREAPQRNLVYLIASLMGHSTPAITLEHYIHCADYLLGSALKTGFKLEPHDIGANGLGLALRTYQRYSVYGWPGLIRALSKHHTVRWTEGENKRKNIKRSSHKTGKPLYERYYTSWHALKWIAHHGTLDSASTLEAKVDNDELTRLRKRANELKKQGLLNKDYPSFPHGNRREAIIQEFTQLFEIAMASHSGQRVIQRLCDLWLTNKIKNRGALRFREPDIAKKYIDSLIELGIPWKQIGLTWVGSRFTQREAKECRAYWRKSLDLSRRISIETLSIQNNRPLKKSMGYMDIRVLNLSSNINDIKNTASVEFQWVTIMTIICESERD